MGQECSEAAPIRGHLSVASPRRQRPSETVWDQPALWRTGEVVIVAKLVVDGPGGLLCASFEASDFWTGDRLAAEVRPALHFPRDRVAALGWVCDAMSALLDQIGPF